VPHRPARARPGRCRVIPDQARPNQCHQNKEPHRPSVGFMGGAGFLPGACLRAEGPSCASPACKGRVIAPPISSKPCMGATTLRGRTAASLRWVSEWFGLGHYRNPGRGPRKMRAADLRKLKLAQLRFKSSNGADAPAPVLQSQLLGGHDFVTE